MISMEVTFHTRWERRCEPGRSQSAFRVISDQEISGPRVSVTHPHGSVTLYSGRI